MKIVRNTAGELLSHDRYNEAHLKSIALTPRLIEHGIFIDELPNDRGTGNYERFRYYVTGLKLGDSDYTVKMVVGMGPSGRLYYDHALTQIEKGSLIDALNRISGAENTNKTSLSSVRDTRLLDLLKQNFEQSRPAEGTPDTTRR